MLSQVLPAEKIDSLYYYKKCFYELKDSKQFHTFYAEFYEFKKSISKTIDDSIRQKELPFDTAGNFLNVHFPFIKFTYEVEGTIFYLSYKNDALRSRAKQTRGKEDDSYLQLISELYFRDDEYNRYSWPLWVNKQSCISGSSRLGDFVTLQCYKKIQTELKRNPLFAPELRLILQDFHEGLTLFGAFDYSKEKVLHELREIVRYDPTMAEEIAARIKEIETSNYQFDCIVNKCHFE